MPHIRGYGFGKLWPHFFPKINVKVSIKFSFWLYIVIFFLPIIVRMVHKDARLKIASQVVVLYKREIKPPDLS